MTDAPGPDTPKGPPLKVGGLKRKVGPLPLWAWYAGGGVLLGGLVLFLRRDSGTPVVAGDEAALTGAISEDAYGAGYMSGAGAWDMGYAGTDGAAPTDAAPAEMPDLPAGYMDAINSLNDTAFMLASSASPWGGADEPVVLTGGGPSTAAKSPISNTKKTTTIAGRQAQVTSAKKATAKQVNTTSNARKGQAYTTKKLANGNELHTYASGKKVEVKKSAKSTIIGTARTVPNKLDMKSGAKVVAQPKVAKTGPNAGKSYSTVRNSDGSEYHLYADGRRIQTKAATKKKAKK